jgi:hypothetical protein
MAVIVHGIAAADAVSALSDHQLAEVAERPVRTVSSGALAALVSDVPGEQALPSRANLLAHTRLLELVAGQSTVLPMRFGVVAPDDAAIRDEYLSARQEPLTEALDHVEGCVELRVRARYAEDEVIRAVLAHDRAAARLRERQDVAAKIRLGERIANGIDARRVHDAATLHAALAPHAIRVADSDAPGALDVLAASFLVERDAVDGFERALSELAAEMEPIVTLQLVGPLPPFSFSEV